MDLLKGEKEIVKLFTPIFQDSNISMIVIVSVTFCCNFYISEDKCVFPSFQVSEKIILMYWYS